MYGFVWNVVHVLGTNSFVFTQFSIDIYAYGGMERNQISDIRPPKKSNIRYQTPLKN